MILKLSEGEYPRVDRGEGEVIILLHGMFGSPDNWLHQVEQLSDNYRVIVLELPIFEQSWDDPSIKGISKYATDFLDWAGIDKAVFVGNSLGGHVALYMACFHKERVSGLVLSGASGLAERGYEQGLPTNPGRDWIHGRVSEVFFNKDQIRPGMVDEVEQFLTKRRNKFRLVKVAKAVKQTHMGEHLDKISAPTLLLWGIEDEVTPIAVAHEFNERIEQSKLETMELCGHAAMMEKPEWFTDKLREFIEGINN
ncbi:alpha/beta hydrolase [bacterium]|nr:alpha/beta hydrolase [bacterium]